jgi:hypothetical protein
MTIHFKRMLIGILSTVLLCVCASTACFAAEKKNMQGWEKDSPYNKLYDPNEMDKIKGVVVKITEVTPLPGMSPAVALLIREAEEEETLVHLCPTWYRKPNAVGIRRGDEVKVKGVWAEVNGEFVFMASKVKKGDYFEFKVRLTKDGTPFWTMSPEELAKETASD